jgi:two-component system response regulator YesN
MIEDNAAEGVLVVDDEPLVLKYTTSVISGLGYKQVLKASNAQEARAIMRTEKLALVICDVSLPDGDGRQIISEALEENPDAAGVLITGYATGDLKLPAELRDHVQLLEKPFTADDISHILAELIDRRMAPH